MIAMILTTVFFAVVMAIVSLGDLFDRASLIFYLFALAAGAI
jgi:hypothetical protein